MSAERSTPSVPRCADGLHNFREIAVCACAKLASGPEQAESRPGMVTVYDEWRRYLGCMGKQTWEDLVRDSGDKPDQSPYRGHQTHAYTPTYRDGA